MTKKEHPLRPYGRIFIVMFSLAGVGAFFWLMLQTLVPSAEKLKVIDLQTASFKIFCEKNGGWFMAGGDYFYSKCTWTNGEESVLRIP